VRSSGGGSWRTGPRSSRSQPQFCASSFRSRSSRRRRTTCHEMVELKDNDVSLSAFHARMRQ
jgi:hypothetical protein